MITRWDLDHSYGDSSVFESEDGEFVKWEDHKAYKAQVHKVVDDWIDALTDPDSFQQSEPWVLAVRIKEEMEKIDD